MWKLSIVAWTNVRYALAEDGRLGNDLWPEALRPTPEIVKNIKETWELVPFRFEEVCEWADVIRNNGATDHTRRYVIIYKVPSTSDSSVVFAVTLRVQGFLNKFCLKKTGNWDGSV